MMFSSNLVCFNEKFIRFYLFYLLFKGEKEGFSNSKLGMYLKYYLYIYVSIQSSFWDAFLNCQRNTGKPHSGRIFKNRKMIYLQSESRVNSNLDALR